MKKIIIGIILCLIIVISFSYVYIKIGANGSENNYFNTNLRYKVARIPWLRSITGLHFDGDAKADYLGSRYENILVEVDIMKGASIKRSVLDALEKNIQAITGKKTRVLVSDEQIAYVQNLDQTAIKKIVTQSRNYLSLDNTAMVYLIVGGSDEKDPTQIGSTFEEYGIVLYLDTLKKYANAKEENFDAYAEGIILHEFGHLLGLNHNSDQGCLMNSNTEFTNAYVEKGKIITDFCLAEKNAIRQMKY